MPIPTWVKKILPQRFFDIYHWCMAYIGAYAHGHPSHLLFVIGVTGTKGKSTVAELIRAILAEDGKKVALASTVRFVIGNETEPNLFKMTMPGRGYLQEFLRRAADEGCTHVVVEMTSEGAMQHRHRGIMMNALVFTNLQREHIERHGSFENYAAVKLSIGRYLLRSPKHPRYIVANADDAYGQAFLDIPVEKRVPFSLKDAEPYTADDRSLRFVWKGELFTVPLPGLFNLRNTLAAMTLADAIGIPRASIKRALEHISPTAGRVEPVEQGQPFTVIVDYAHTPDSLRALFETYAGKRIIAVMGSTGGGRDQWKRPEMGKIADEMCAQVILTNEDPYNEDPHKIINDIAQGFLRLQPQIILERRAAIAQALAQAKEGDAVLITGKGTDPYIMGPRGQKTPWSDRKVAQEELRKLGYN